MSFDLTPTAAQHDLAKRTHEFAQDVVRLVASEYDQRQEFPWPVLEEAAARGFYSPLFYRDLIGDPTGLPHDSTARLKSSIPVLPVRLTRQTGHRSCPVVVCNPSAAISRR